MADCALVLAGAAPAEKDPAARAGREKRAVELLQRARAGGLFRKPGVGEAIRKDPTIQVLKDRDDFKQFLSDLEADRPSKDGPEK